MYICTLCSLVKKKEKSRRMCDKRNERKKEEEAARMDYDEDGGAGGWNSRDSGPGHWLEGVIQHKAGKGLMDRIMRDNIWVRPCVTKSLFIGSPGGLPERGILKKKI